MIIDLVAALLSVVGACFTLAGVAFLFILARKEEFRLTDAAIMLFIAGLSLVQLAQLVNRI